MKVQSYHVHWVVELVPHRGELFERVRPFLAVLNVLGLHPPSVRSAAGKRGMVVPVDDVVAREHQRTTLLDTLIWFRERITRETVLSGQ